jgi:hypothetical protein
MNRIISSRNAGLGAVVVLIAAATVLLLSPVQRNAQLPGTTKLIAQNAVLAGLPGGKFYPFTGTTPNRIVSAHITITDSTLGAGIRHSCASMVIPPDNIRILVGEVGGGLVSVMNAVTSTGVGSDDQCIFHVIVTPGENGVPAKATDIIVFNDGNNPLTASNTITLTAEVR